MWEVHQYCGNSLDKQQSIQVLMVPNSVQAEWSQRKQTRFLIRLIDGPTTLYGDNIGVL